MEMNGGFLVTKIKQLGDRIFEKILSEKNIDAFNGAQGRILYVLWQAAVSYTHLDVYKRQVLSYGLFLIIPHISKSVRHWVYVPVYRLHI